MAPDTDNTIEALLEQRSQYEQWLAKLDSAGPGKPPSGVDVTLSRARFLQGRDWNRLRGFSRVGGVLIGREAARGGPRPDVADLRWEADGPGLRLVLVRADGREVRSRPHRAGLIRQALAYAADGRKVAVTICDASPLGEHSVLLHPVFVDTPLEECASRDPKGLYRKARAGEVKNFTGIDSPYELPTAPEIRLETPGKTPEDMVEVIEAWLREKDLADDQYDSGGGI